MKELMHGIFVFALYLGPLAAVMLLLRRFTRVGNELFRKMLHFLFLGAYIPLLRAFDKWWMLSGFAAALIVIFYPLLLLADRVPMFSAFVNGRKHGEFKNSLVLALGVMAVCVTVCWGLMGDKLLVLACIYAWGVGDAFAALVGKKFGRHKITWKYADKHKSVEGSAAMFVTSAVAVLCVLLAHNHLSAIAYVVLPIAGAAAATVVEMVTKDGRDTVYCPAAAMLVMIPLMALLGGFV